MRLVRRGRDPVRSARPRTRTAYTRTQRRVRIGTIGEMGHMGGSLTRQEFARNSCNRARVRPYSVITATNAHGGHRNAEARSQWDAKERSLFDGKNPQRAYVIGCSGDAVQSSRSQTCTNTPAHRKRGSCVFVVHGMGSGLPWSFLSGVRTTENKGVG